MVTHCKVCGRPRKIARPPARTIPPRYPCRHPHTKGGSVTRAPHGLRYGTQANGFRYVARDRCADHLRPWCEHAVWRDGEVVWIPHEEGGNMQPFTGPDDVYAELTEGGHELWKPDQVVWVEDEDPRR